MPVRFAQNYNLLWSDKPNIMCVFTVNIKYQIKILICYIIIYIYVSQSLIILFISNFQKFGGTRQLNILKNKVEDESQKSKLEQTIKDRLQKLGLERLGKVEEHIRTI